MGIFSLTQELAIDLGTANTLIIYNGKVVVDEPSIVALDVHTGKLVAIGHQAHQMHERTNPNIKTIRPLKDGVIADFNATELMLRGMIKKVKTSGSLFAPSLRMVICIPSGSTNVEIRAVRDSAEHAGGREGSSLFCGKFPFINLILFIFSGIALTLITNSFSSLLTVASKL